MPVNENLAIPVIKGPMVVLADNLPAGAYGSPTRSVDCRGYNMLHLQPTVSGSGWATIEIRVASDPAGNWLAIDIPGYFGHTSIQNHITAGTGTAIEVPIGGPYAGLVMTVSGADTRLTVLAFAYLGAGLPYTASVGTPYGGVQSFTKDNLGAVVDVASVVGVSAANLYGLNIENDQAATAYIQLFDQAASTITLGTTTPYHQYRVPASSSRDVVLPAVGVLFNAAISIASTTTRGGATPSAAGVYVNVNYLGQ